MNEEYRNSVSGYNSEQAWEIAEERWRRETDEREFGPPDSDWKAIEAQAKIDLEAIQTDADAYRFISTYLSKELQPNYRQIYRSDRHEMNRTPREAVNSILSLPPL